MRIVMLSLVTMVVLAVLGCAGIGESEVDEANEEFRAAWVRCHRATTGTEVNRQAFAIRFNGIDEAATILRGDNTPAGEYPDPDLVTAAQWQAAHDVYMRGIEELAAICPEVSGGAES